MNHKFISHTLCITERGSVFIADLLDNGNGTKFNYNRLLIRHYKDDDYNKFKVIRISESMKKQIINKFNS